MPNYDINKLSENELNMEIDRQQYVLNTLIPIYGINHDIIAEKSKELDILILKWSLLKLEDIKI